MNRFLMGDQFFPIVENSIENCTGFSNSVLVTGSGSFCWKSAISVSFLHQFLCIIGIHEILYLTYFDNNERWTCA